MESDFFFQGWSGLLRVVVVGALAYIALIVLLRGAGPRALSKLNSFDFVVTVALGSILASILLSQSVALVEGIVAFLVLLTLQYAVTWLSVRSSKVDDIVKSEPVLLLYRGKMLQAGMTRARVVSSEIEAAVRGQGLAELEDVFAVVLETDGSLSVTSSSSTDSPSAFQGVPLPDNAG